MLSSELSLCSFFLIVHLALDIAAASSATCYLPDGSTANGHTPCSDLDSQSACCEDGSICMTNGFCLDQMVVSRHSCTDRAWQDPACPLAGDCYQGASCPAFSLLQSRVISCSHDPSFTPGTLGWRRLRLMYWCCRHENEPQDQRPSALPRKQMVLRIPYVPSPEFLPQCRGPGPSG